MGLPVDSS